MESPRVWGVLGLAYWSDVTEVFIKASRLHGIDYSSTDLQPGMSVRRQFSEETHTVYVVVPIPDHTTDAQKMRGWHRYIYKGNRYKTLSGVARKITGDDTLSGNRFFRLRRRRRGHAA